MVGLKKIFLLCAAVLLLAFLAACSGGEVERFVSPEDENIFVAAEDAYADEPFREPGDEGVFAMTLYLSPNANTPETFLYGSAWPSFRSVYKIDELLEGKLFDAAGRPFHDPQLRRMEIQDDAFYFFDTGGHYLFNEYAQEIGVIRVLYENRIPVGLEILTVEEFEEHEGFIESFEAAAYFLGAEFRLPTEHMEIYGEPMFAESHSWLNESGRLMVMFDAEDRPEAMGRRSAALIIFIEDLGGADIDYYIERFMPDKYIERPAIAGTIVRRLTRDTLSTLYMWEHNGLLYSVSPPRGVNVTGQVPYNIFSEQEIRGLIASMVW